MNKTKWVIREFIHYRSSHLLILLTLVLGLSGILVIEQLKTALLGSISSQEKELLSSDIALRARRPLAESEIKKFIDSFDVEASYQTFDMSSMIYVPRTDSSRLVEVRVVEPSFPFYGSLESEKGIEHLSLDHSLFAKNCLWLHLDTARLLELSLNEKLKLGEAEFEFCGIINKDSTQGFRGFALAPRVYMARSQLARTKLFGDGTIASHSLHLKLKTTPENLLEIQKKLLKDFDDPSLKINLPQDTSEQVARAGKLFSDYLQLASLVAFILAVIGIYYLFRALTQLRIKDTAILRSLGVTPREVAALLLIPVVINFFVSLPLAILSCQALFLIMSLSLKSLFGVDLIAQSIPWHIWPSLPFVFIFLIFSLMPTVIDAIRRPVITLIQSQTVSFNIGRFSVISCWSVSLLSLYFLSVWASHSWKIATLFVIGLIGSVLIFVLIIILVKWLFENLIEKTTSLSSPFGFELGLIIRRLMRNPSMTIISVVSLGLGAVLISLLSHLEMSLGQEFTISKNDKPSLFMFDIQDEQVEDLKIFLKENDAPLQAISPMVRGRLESVNEKPFNSEEEEKAFQTREEENESRFRQRVMNLSWADDLNSSETLIKGVKFSQAKVGEGEFPISLEKRFAERLKLQMGDELKFSVLGVPLIGRVVNTRSVKWTSFRPNFFITFPSGALEEAPKSWLAAVSQMEPDEKVRLQNQLVKKFPNVSVVDVTQLVEKLMELFTRLKSALELMAYFTMAVGVVVVVSMAQDQLNRRVGEIMLEKTLGITPFRVMRMMSLEFIILGAGSFLLGGICGAMLASFISVIIFEGDVVWNTWIILQLILIGSVLMGIPLFFMARRVFLLRPAGLLQRL